MTPTELRDWQKQMGLTTYTAADALGVCRRTYSRWVTGEAPISRITALACAALKAGIDVPTGKEPKNAKTRKNSRNYLDFSGW